MTTDCIRLLQEGAQALSDAGIHRPAWTAEQLLAEQLGCLPVDLYIHSGIVRDGESTGYRTGIAARAGGVPLQYLLGTADFYGRRFSVGPGVFNPRPETEVLIQVALEVIPLTQPSPLRGEGKGEGVVADVGTGSGAIAVTLAKERPGLELVAVEQSDVALHFARRNAAAHGCAVRFVKGDLLEGFAAGSLEAVVANPPYLDPLQAGTWPRELAWEPWIALDGGDKGMELIGRLMRQARVVLEPGGCIILEIGMDQAGGVRDLAEQNGFRTERIVPDLAGLDRVAVLWKN